VPAFSGGHKHSPVSTRALGERNAISSRVFSPSELTLGSALETKVEVSTNPFLDHSRVAGAVAVCISWFEAHVRNLQVAAESCQIPLSIAKSRAPKSAANNADIHWQEQAEPFKIPTRLYSSPQTCGIYWVRGSQRWRARRKIRPTDRPRQMGWQ
jgi:hypothetical protein